MRSRAPLLAGAVVLLPSGADAHAFAQRYDLPLPLWHYLVGAGAAVALSFAVSALFLAGGRPAPTVRLALPAPAAGVVRRAVGLLAVGALALLLAVGFGGGQGDWDSNLLPVTVWVVWWVGVAFVSALVGGVWPLLDPWLAAARLFVPSRAPLRWPERVDAWPAVLLFLGFAWAELAWTENAVPRKLAALAAAYSLLTWTGMALFGIDAWRAHADPFARFFGLFARFAPLALERGGILVVRPFGAGLRQERVPSAAEAGFVLLALGTVSFDGIAETPLWDGAVGWAMGLLYAAGVVQLIGYAAAGSLIDTLGLVATPLLLAAAYLGTCALVGRIAGEPPGLTARRYVLSLVPIAVAYHLAHYLSYLLIQGQAVWPLLSDPLNLGWDLFGTRGHEVDIAVVDVRFVWNFAVVAIVVGHAAAAVLAHLEALRVAPGRRRAAVASQGPMLLLMVVYTMLSLWVLSQPIVEV